jgi:hypothetical protein
MKKQGEALASGMLFVLVSTALVISLFGIAFSQLTTDGATNYATTDGDSNNYTVFNKAAELSNTTQNMNSAFNSNQTTTGSGTLDSYNTVFGLGITIARIATTVPAVYNSMILSMAASFGIDGAVVNIFILIVIIAVVAIGLKMLLGRNI